MGKFSQPARTVRDIKTLAGKSDDLLTPHKMYMRLFALETERHRREQERASAMARVDSIDARFAEIDREKEQILGLLGVSALPLSTLPEQGNGKAPDASTRRAAPRRRARVVTESTPVASPVADPVKILY